MTEQKSKRKRWPIVLLGLTGLCLIAAIAGSLGDGTDQLVGTPAEARPTAVRSAAAVPSAATPRPVAPSFQEIETTVAGMTEAQWKLYLEGLEGQQIVNWTGTILEVNQKLGGSYEAWIDMDEPGELSTQDVYLPVPADIALTLNKNAPVTFSGVIKTATELLGSVTIHIEPEGAVIDR